MKTFKRVFMKNGKHYQVIKLSHGRKICIEVVKDTHDSKKLGFGQKVSK